jgi:hypothetical protein
VVARVGVVRGGGVVARVGVVRGGGVGVALVWVGENGGQSSWRAKSMQMMVLLPLPLDYVPINQPRHVRVPLLAPLVMVGHQGVPAGEVDAYVASVIAARFNALDTAAIVAKGGKPPPAAKAPAAKAPAAKGAFACTCTSMCSVNAVTLTSVTGHCTVNLRAFSPRATPLSPSPPPSTNMYTSHEALYGALMFTTGRGYL